MIVPYDAKPENGIEKADHLLVPYNRYVELWNRAYPDKKLEAHPAPLPYALSGVTYNATLEGDEAINVIGQMQINVLVDDYVSIPLALRGGVLARAMLDGKPGKLKIVDAPPLPQESAQASKALTPGPSPERRGELPATLFLLQVTGKGPHKLEMEVRLKLARVGGWRGTAGGAAHRAGRDGHVPRAAAADRSPLGPLRRSPQP